MKLKSKKEVSANTEYETLAAFIDDRLSNGGVVRLVVNEQRNTGGTQHNLVINVVKPDEGVLKDNEAFEHTMEQIPGFLCVYTSNEDYMYIKEDSIIRVLVK